jgi:hypothetical protein
VQKTIGNVVSHFLDSGAFTLWTKAADYTKEHKTDKWAYYDSPEFWTYCDDYAKFIKKYQIGIDLYANVDVIPNPELTWRNQCYFERKHGLRPVPVVHYKTDLKWLSHYINRGYKLIGLGGLVGSTAQDSCIDWIDRAFKLVCSSEDRLPKVKIHGFGVTSYTLMLRYPWWSVDSTSWCMVGAFGSILIPHKRKGRFVFSEPPYVMKVSVEKKARMVKSHYKNKSPVEQRIIRDWLEFINIPLGKIGTGGEVEEIGVMTCTYTRRAANILFFEEMCKSLPKWPWPFKSSRQVGFDDL